MRIFARSAGKKKEKAKKQDKDAVRHTHVNVFKVHRNPLLSPSFPLSLPPSRLQCGHARQQL